MPRRRHPRAAGHIPAEILPPDFLTRHDLVRRLYLDPLAGLTPRHPWAPMTDAEWAAIAPILADHGCGLREAERPGRPMADPRARLDAIFRAVTLKRPDREGGGRAPWRALPPEFGRADTVSRSYRRWTRTDLWMRLLMAVADPGAPPALTALTYRICCAFRRGIRLMGLRAILLARRLRLHSALPAPSAFLPDPDLSESYQPVFLGFATYAMAHPGWSPPPSLFRLLRQMHGLAGGRRRLSPAMEPP